MVLRKNAMVDFVRPSDNSGSEIQNGKRRSFLTWTERFLRDPNIGSVIPSSQSAVEMICDCIDFSRALRIAEFGPGDGVITEEILQRMDHDARVYAFETNGDFMRELEENFDDPRLRLFHLSAEHVEQQMQRFQESLDVIVSGIPFSFFDDAKALRVIRGAHASLASHGQFLLFQAYLPPFRTTHRLQKLLRPYFTLELRRTVVSNIPPLEILVAFKKAPCSEP
jgi:phospholipid N-methyltransferase